MTKREYGFVKVFVKQRDRCSDKLSPKSPVFEVFTDMPRQRQCMRCPVCVHMPMAVLQPDFDALSVGCACEVLFCGRGNDQLAQAFMSPERQRLRWRQHVGSCLRQRDRACMLDQAA
jgi:hypothetical protein